ncbi:hypothetical protein B0A77_13760 [Flavobacterium branchiophilum]|uniref:Uncharacterized protein n=1 Tax=Flavobacterium branchiophilum TaxID=55197 RepID=A0A2H3K8T2_9FLAO|nr:hypothetical protein B0A77_13760 [Flavobacterium branchiophilum]
MQNSIYNSIFHSKNSTKFPISFFYSKIFLLLIKKQIKKNGISINISVLINHFFFKQIFLNY